MKELILMTAAFRIDNLMQSYYSIEENFSGLSDVHVTWLICYDKYNAYGDIEKVKKLCQRGNSGFGMGWLIYPNGKENQKNYGGDLYNEPLNWIKEKWFKTSDPWVYIFDDDNVIHPAMAKNFTYITNICEEKNKEIIWFTMSHEKGGLSPAYRDGLFAYHNNEDGSHVCFAGLPDPSQILMKYSTIEKMGFYDSTFEYDRKLWMYLETNFSSILLPDEWLDGVYGIVTSQVQAYHNGQPSNEQFEYLNKIQKKTYSLLCQGNSTTEPFCERIVLPEFIGEKCLSDAENYYYDKNYLKDNRIFKNIDRIYILTQVDTPHRWNFVIEQFKKLGVYDEICNKITLVKGVKIPGLNENVVKKIFDEGLGNPIYSAEQTYNVPFFNCTNEHYRILNQAIADDYKTIMIIEDDACFLKDISVLKKALSTIPENFSILHLEGFINIKNSDKKDEIINALAKTPDEGTWTPYSKLSFWASGCLIYSRAGMEKYVEEQRDYVIGVDNRLGNVVQDAYTYSYPIVRQEDRTRLKSGIESFEIGDEKNLYLTFSNKKDYFSMFD